jgi:hypothetical protein
VRDELACSRAQKICKAAKVLTVSAHGMRGLHGTLAVDSGITSRAVAPALGHSMRGLHSCRTWGSCGLSASRLCADRMPINVEKPTIVPSAAETSAISAICGGNGSVLRAR